MARFDGIKTTKRSYDQRQTHSINYPKQPQWCCATSLHLLNEIRFPRSEEKEKVLRLESGV